MTRRSTTRRSTHWMLAVALSGMGLALVATAPAGAKASRTAAATTGYARAGHFAPGKGPVDLIVDGKVAAKGLTYKQVTPYLPVPAGPHSFALRTAAGQTVLQVRAGVPANGAVTIGAVTTREGLAGNVYDDHLEAPTAGTALVRFVHTAPIATKVDIGIVGGATLAKNVDYPSATPYQSLKAGKYTIDVRAVTTHKLLLRIKDWNAAAGTQSSIVLVNTEAGTLDAVPFVDAAGTAAAPQGGMATGLGGTAVNSAHESGWSAGGYVAVLGGIVAISIGFGGVLMLRRRRVE